MALSRRATLPAGHRHRLMTMQRHPTPSRVVTMKVSVPTHCVPSHGCSCITARANCLARSQASTHAARIVMVCRARAVLVWQGPGSRARRIGVRNRGIDVHLALRQESAHVVDPTRQLPDGGQGARQGQRGKRAQVSGSVRARGHRCAHHAEKAGRPQDDVPREGVHAEPVAQHNA